MEDKQEYNGADSIEKDMGKCFDAIHDQIYTLETCIRRVEDSIGIEKCQELKQAWDNAKITAMKKMRRLRVHLNIGYGGHTKRR